MTDAPEPHTVGGPFGQHGLGPHVVGQRIVVRHLLPDGRATDVLGVCTAWGDGVLTIESLRGPVTVAVADIVTGKPVPPRASVRQRVPAREVELHSFAHWDEMLREPVGEWLVRSSPPVGGRLLKRANSALAMGDPGMSLPEAAGAVLAAYARLDRRALAQVELGSSVEAGLLDLGWTPLGIGDSHTQLAPVPRALRAAGRGLDSARFTETGATCLVEYGDGPVVARGEAALDGDWLLLHTLHVDPARRREGLATGVLAELLDWGASRGATTAWLHAETDNEAGLATYDRLGFVTHHTNRYLAAPEIR